MKHILLVGLLFGFLASHIKGANILGLFAFPSQSHFNAVQAVMTGLAKKNHNVTTVSSYRLGEKLDNYEEIVVPAFDFWTDVQHELGSKHIFEAVHASSNRWHKALRAAGAALSDYFLQQPKLKELLSSVNDFNYDLIIIDLFYTEALLMLGEVSNKPIVAISSSNFENYMTTLVEDMVPTACSSIDFETYNPDASFSERISNIFECSHRRSQHRKHLTAQDQIATKHFSKFNRPLPLLHQVQGRIAITFLNNYAPLLIPRPTLTNIIPVGGVHIKPTQDIQWNIKRFLDDARDGSIYLSFGTGLKCSDLPKDKLSALIAVLGKQKQHILWHCDIERIENLPKNILLQKIISSSDVLAHPHLKYFITSGGLLSLQEAIYRNVPVLGIPVFRDQNLNIQIVENLGIGIKLDFSNLTEASLTWALKELLTDRSYLTNVREVSSKFRDRPLGAVQTSLYWIEHVLRHKTVSHLKTPGADNSWRHSFLMDLIVLFVLSVVGVLVVGYGLYRVASLIYEKRKVNKLYTKLR